MELTSEVVVAGVALAAGGVGWLGKTFAGRAASVPAANGNSKLTAIETLVNVIREERREDRAELRTIYAEHSTELRAVVIALQALTERIVSSSTMMAAHESATAVARDLVRSTHEMVDDIHREMVPPRLSRP